MKVRNPLIILLMFVFSFSVSNAKTLFVDDFEGGTKGKWFLLI